MTSHPSLRRLLVVAALAVSLALAPRAEARPHPPRPRPLPAAWAVRSEDPLTAALDFVRDLLHSVWANAGSSLDPLGIH